MGLIISEIGSCSCPGMVGATIGAGVGRLQGLDGLVIDALVSVRLVTANGSIVEASETVNAELFWGIRGAGANFGIITVATYKLTPLHNGGQVTNVDLIFGAASNASYFEVLASFEGNMPAELAIITDIVYNATAGAVSTYSLLSSCEKRILTLARPKSLRTGYTSAAKTRLSM